MPLKDLQKRKEYCKKYYQEVEKFRRVRHPHMSEMVEIKCLECGKLFKAKPSAIKRGFSKYCSRVCFGISTRGRTGWWSKNQTWTKGTKQSVEARRKNSEAHKGVKSYLWMGGLSSKNTILRNSLEYKLWREAVYQRDNFTCQICGDNKGGNLEAHHLKPFSLFTELRFAIDNGQTLCKECHKKTDSYLKPLSLLTSNNEQIK